MFQNILVGLDGSEGSRHALEQALRLATLTRGAVHAVSVEEKIPAYAATVGEVDDEVEFENRYFKQMQEEAARTAANRRVKLTFEVVKGHAADRLVAASREYGADLLVLGHTGHSRLHNVLLGSTADRVVEQAACPVLIVR